MHAICANPACQHVFEANAAKVKQGQERYCSRPCYWADYTPRPLAERFWERVDKISTPEGCWLWTGRQDKGTGYGTMTDPIPGTKKYRVLLAHRVGYTLQYGPIPVGLHVLHKPPCFNRLCIRHLYPGTPQDNSNDTKKLGRTTKGKPKNRRIIPEHIPSSSRYNQKLSPTDVQTIRVIYTGQPGEQAALARRYNVSPHTINNILHGRSHIS